ncbi:MAG: phosphate ABC transporter permease subunit PstC [Chloroflexota bacterium]
MDHTTLKTPDVLRDQRPTLVPEMDDGKMIHPLRTVPNFATAELPQSAPDIALDMREPKRIPHPIAPTYNVGDRIFGLVTTAFACLIVLILLVMLAMLAIQSRESMSRFGVGFLTSTTWDSIQSNFGAASAILGTVYTSVLALAVAAPIGILIAIFLVEMAPRRARYALGFLVELLAAVPSIVFGLWALVVLVPLVAQYVEPQLLKRFGNIPIFSGIPVGLGYFTASVILAIMILPTITAISRDVLLAVPNTQRDAMLALGATRWETIWKVVVPYARSGIVGAIVLALGRAVGETMAVQMVIGNSQSFSPSLFNFGTTITATLVNQFAEATGTLYKSSLLELGLILMVVTIVLNGFARLLVWRVASPVKVQS